MTGKRKHVAVSWKFGEAVTGDRFEVKSRRVEKLRDRLFLEKNHHTFNVKHRSQVIFYQSDNQHRCDPNKPLDWRGTIPDEYFYDPSTVTPATRPPTLWIKLPDRNGNHVDVSWKSEEGVTGDRFEVKSGRVEDLRDAFFLEKNHILNFKHRSQVIFCESDECDPNKSLDFEGMIPDEYFYDPSTATPATRPPSLWVKLPDEGDGNILPTESSQGPASGFTAKGQKQLQGVGTLSPVFFERKESIKMGLNTDKYHLKSMDDFFEIFENRTNKSLTHMLEVTSRLADSEYFCLPIGVRLKDKHFQDDAIIFPKLADYCIGFPQEKNDRVLLLKEMVKAVRAMHEKGVVHNDLYLSNFMWKEEDDGTFSVKIIDFDAAYELGERLTDCTLDRILDIMPVFDSCTAIRERDMLYMVMLTNNLHHEDLLKRKESEENDEVEVKKRLDGACQQCMTKILKRYKRDVAMRRHLDNAIYEFMGNTENGMDVLIEKIRNLNI